jgi:hypothetical protein
VLEIPLSFYVSPSSARCDSLARGRPAYSLTLSLPRLAAAPKKGVAKLSEWASQRFVNYKHIHKTRLQQKRSSHTENAVIHKPAAASITQKVHMGYRISLISESSNTQLNVASLSWIILCLPSKWPAPVSVARRPHVTALSRCLLLFNYTHGVPHLIQFENTGNRSVVHTKYFEGANFHVFFRYMLN